MKLKEYEVGYHFIGGAYNMRVRRNIIVKAYDKEDAKIIARGTAPRVIFEDNIEYVKEI